MSCTPTAARSCDRAVHRDLELARQVAELGVEGRPLADQLAPDEGIDDLVRATPAKWSVVMLRMQLPEVWMACISTVASSARISGTSSSLRPVELQVLARREVAVAAVVLARDLGELAQLARRRAARRGWRCAASAHSAGCRGRSSAAARGTRPRRACPRGSAASGRGTARPARQPAAGRFGRRYTCFEKNA